MIICPHCASIEPISYAKLPKYAGVYWVCMRCEGVSLYHEIKRKKRHLEYTEILLRKATKAEFGSIRNTVEMMLLRRLREKYLNTGK